ncbi:protein adenylyltransferase SelO [Winogradskyella immobilis]|uniref:Protein nucleotidyltransferase YdiU n=1 Tax=Winogradskyella immobilis TaxID=2816852 RepID=A0ABS8EJ83_9FLAO|nr:YdiU family protein [Winogradskyella immobilis]MCC1483107.1 YdiU family protein [Winogradskyella immobilis]MCG0015202.1 YdiU family protein [Winogradskyella immobilis]
MQLNISDTFNKELPADPVMENTRRKVFEATHSYVTPQIPLDPKIVHVSKDMLNDIGLDEKSMTSEDFFNIFSGKKVYPQTKPYAMAYAGHQFGNWAGQLGDGRAINLFEVSHNKKRWALQLKGAGATPYSRQGDGLAVLRSSIREYLCSEAMHHLGVPTTRALSLMLSGNKVLRDILYDGNANYEKGAIVTRLAPSFIRFGNFELFAARKELKNLKVLTDYTIKHFYPELGKPSKATYIAFFKTVSERTLKMIVDWQRVGFVHGVMNTDNMSILGLTIDYGPYGWLEGFDFGWTPNTTDAQNKRYRYGNQPNIGLWNLYQLANALYPLIEDTTPLEDILNTYKTNFDIESLQMMRSKLGLELKENSDKQLISDLEDCLLLLETDMTIFFRLLSNYKKGNSEKGIECIKDAFYKPEEFSEVIQEKWKGWFSAYDSRLGKETILDEERLQKMNAVNPKYVLRNYMAQLAIDKADEEDYSLIETFFNMLQNPYKEQPEYQHWFAKRPDWARHKVGCSMLSCSS